MLVGVLHIFPMHLPLLNNQMKDCVKAFPLLQNKNPRQTICSSHTSFACNRFNITSRQSHLLPGLCWRLRGSPSSQQLTAQINLVVKSTSCFFFFFNLYVIRNKIQQFRVSRKSFTRQFMAYQKNHEDRSPTSSYCTLLSSPSHNFPTAQWWWEPETEIRQVCPVCGFLLMWMADGDSATESYCSPQTTNKHAVSPQFRNHCQISS